jgi:hypothetical protein
MFEKIFSGATIACGTLVIVIYLLAEASRPPSPPWDPRDIPISASSSPTPDPPADGDTRTRTPVSDPLSPPQELAVATVKPAIEPPAVESPAVESPAPVKVKGTPSPKVSISEERLAHAKRQRARAEELRRVRHFYEWQWRPEARAPVVESAAAVESVPTAEAPAPPATPVPIVRSNGQTDDAGAVVDGSLGEPKPR